MCDKRNYKRFRKIYDYLTVEQDSKLFYDALYSVKAHTFKTLLGNRIVVMILDNISKDLTLSYYDKDGSVLFEIEVNTKGKISINHSLIDETSIFGALFEIDCIIHDEKKIKRGELLDYIFTLYSQQNSLGLFQGWW